MNVFTPLMITVTGQPPFRAETMNATARNIMNCEVSVLFFSSVGNVARVWLFHLSQISFPEKISDAARDFISACLVADPSDRSVG